jgi:hypothetical protein
MIEDFILGFACLILLTQITSLVVSMCKKYPDLILGIGGAMFAIDLACLLTWTFSLKQFAANEKIFIGGIGLAILTSLIHKTRKFIQMQQEL